MTMPIILLFVLITIVALIQNHRENNKAFDDKVRGIIDRRTYIKVEMANGDTDIYVFSNSRQSREFVEDTEKHMTLGVSDEHLVKSCEIIKYSEYMNYQDERENVAD